MVVHQLRGWFCAKKIRCPMDVFIQRGTLTDPLKRAENDFDEDHLKVRRTMDPDVAMMRNDALVEKLREEGEQTKPISRDVEDMRRLRQKLKSFDAAERKEREKGERD